MGEIRAVTDLIRGRSASDGAGVRLTRLLEPQSRPDLDPFLMLDEFGSDRPGDYLAGFPDHPHRGFETVTYMLDGRMRHRDSLGNSGLLLPGGVQWMTAGRGLVHSEMPEQQDGLLRGFQLWINLPARDKLTAPRYQDIRAEAIPTCDGGPGVTARVVAGRLRDVVGPVQTGATEAYWIDWWLEPQAVANEAVASAEHTAFVYVYEGELQVGGGADEQCVRRGVLAILGPGQRLRCVAGATPARAIFVAGRPLREPVVQ